MPEPGIAHRVGGSAMSEVPKTRPLRPRGTIAAISALVSAQTGNFVNVNAFTFK